MNHEQKGDGRQKAVGESEGVVHAQDEPHCYKSTHRRICEPAHGGRDTSDEGNQDDDEDTVEEVGHRIHVLQKGVERLVSTLLLLLVLLPLLILHSLLSLGKNRLILVRQSFELNAGLPKAAVGIEKVGLGKIQKGHGLVRVGLEVGQELAPTPVQLHDIRV